MSIISAPSIKVNNDTVAIIPNSFEFDEGFGEQDTRTESSGGGEVEQVFADNVEMKYSECSFKMLPTERNIKLARSWKANLNRNVVECVGRSPTGGAALERTFQNASLPANYKVPLAADGDIEVSFKSDSAV